MYEIKFITINHILVAIIIILSITILIGHSIGYKWAGGSGILEKQIVTDMQTGDVLNRGEIMEATDQYKYFTIEKTKIFLSKNTQVKLVNLHDGQIDLQLIQGRMVANGKVNISVRDIDVIIPVNSKASIVHYSWLDELEIAPMTSNLIIEYENQTLELESAIKIHTLQPYEYSNIEFNKTQSSEADFYLWVETQ
jgi:hypothetical protein